MSKTKYLLPLILILLLTFTLIGDCDWLSGHDQRMKLTIDNTKIDATLSWFPVTAQFGQIQLPYTKNRNCRRPGMHAIYDSTADKTFIVFTGEDTHSYITYYDHANKVFGDFVKVGASPSEDYHHYPMLLIDSSGYLWIFYGCHDSTSRYAKSDNVRDISAWTDTALANATFATYSFPVEDDGGDIYVFYRRHNSGTDATYHRPLYFVKTVDGGSNWSTATVCIENTDAGGEKLEEVYIGKIAHESAHDSIPDKVHMIWTMAGGVTHDLYHEDIYYAYFKFSDDHMYAADDTDLGVVINDTELESNCKVVDTGIADEPFDTPYINLVSYKTDGTPIIVYGDVPNNGYYYNEYSSGWGTPVKLVDYSGYSIRDLTYEDSTIKVLINSSSVLSEYTSTNGNDFSSVTLFDGIDFAPSSEYVVNYNSLTRIITYKALADYTNDSPLYLYPGHNVEIFDELTADADFDKSAFTQSDGTTQLYGDCEFFSAGLKRAIYHYSKTGWEISSSADTDSYFYYDGGASSNTTYISKSGNTAAQSVWDSNFLMVCHMVDATTSTLYDSTSNNYDLTKKAANEPLEKDDKEQHFDGTDDYIAQTTLLDTVPANGAISVYFKPDDASEAADNDLLVKINDETGAAQDYITFRWDADAGAGSRFIKGIKNKDGAEITLTSTTEISNSVYYLATMTWGSDGYKWYVNDTVEDTDVDTNDWSDGTTRDFWIGSNNWGGSSVNEFDGVIGEVRVSQTQRTAAWIKATYNSLWDSLLTYSAEEVKPSVTNVLFLFSNF